MKHTAHLDLVHRYWKELLRKGDCAIDATCGNGHDSLILAESILKADIGYLFCYDIQDQAIENTRKKLFSALPENLYKRVVFLNKNHADFSDIPNIPIRLIVYNLGYLPSGNKDITTKTETTIASIKEALLKIRENGAISITAYPGHKEGENEEKALLSFLEKLPSSHYKVSYHKWINRPLSPSVFWIIKKYISQKIPLHPQDPETLNFAWHLS